MASGGARSGAGRKANSVNRLTKESVEQAKAGGLMPLDYMLSLLRDEGKDLSIRLDAAKSAAPYVHPKLAQIAHTGPNGGPVHFTLSPEDEAL